MNPMHNTKHTPRTGICGVDDKAPTVIHKGDRREQPGAHKRERLWGNGHVHIFVQFVGDISVLAQTTGRRARNTLSGVHETGDASRGTAAQRLPSGIVVFGGA